MSCVHSMHGCSITTMLFKNTFTGMKWRRKLAYESAKTWAYLLLGWRRGNSNIMCCLLNVSGKAGSVDTDCSVNKSWKSRRTRLGFLTTGSVDDISQLSVFPLAQVVLLHTSSGLSRLHLRAPVSREQFNVGVWERDRKKVWKTDVTRWRWSKKVNLISIAVLPSKRRGETQHWVQKKDV